MSETKSKVTCTHNGTLIEYNEISDKWIFTLRNRDREVDSLKIAKEVIDTPPKGKPFERIKAWKGEYDGTFSAVDVTSIAGSRYGSHYAWTSDLKTKERSKERANILYPWGPHNDKLVKDIAELCDRRKVLDESIEELVHKLKALEIPEEK